MSLFVICFFSFLIHLTETLALTLRISGINTKKVAIALSFVTTTLLVSRLSNMFQAPLLGHMVDDAILIGSTAATTDLNNSFRIIIFACFLGSFVAFLLTPTFIKLFDSLISKYADHGSILTIGLSLFKPRTILKILNCLTTPTFLPNVSIRTIPKTFLVLNVLIGPIYAIGVLCSLSAGALLPDLRATAIQLSGTVNGIATILLTLFVDPSGARITDEVYGNKRPFEDIVSVVFFLQIGRIIGLLVVSQLLFKPFTYYIAFLTKLLAHLF